jgi:uncharacterized protein (TIGR00299 family) protein
VTKIAYFDCLAGASGDMILGALVDAGLSEQDLRQGLDALNLTAFDLNFQIVYKNGFRATKTDIRIEDNVTERRLPDIVAIIQDSTLLEEIKHKSIAIFQRIGAVEANIHGTPIQEVHLHELGGLDTILDVVGTLVGLEALGVCQVHVSPVPLARGFTHGEHGVIPLPAPATLALLEGVPVVGSDLDIELVTPTGAALLTSLAESFGPIPAMTLETTGYGAGTKELPIPNVIRLLLGTQQTEANYITETLVMIETNIDDLNPEIYEYVMSSLLEAGALDVTFNPIQMKKNRPGILLQVLCQPKDTEKLTSVLFTQTSTLGVRKQYVERLSIQRTIKTIKTPYGNARVKIAHLNDGSKKFAPEYEDCVSLAESNNLPLIDIYKMVETLARDRLSTYS